MSIKRVKRLDNIHHVLMFSHISTLYTAGLYFKCILSYDTEAMPYCYLSISLIKLFALACWVCPAGASCTQGS